MSLVDPLLWVALLLLLSLILVILEVFVPSGGILGFLAVAAAFGAVIMAFYHHGPIVGFSVVMLSVVTLPIAVMLAFKYWPNTPLGRRVMLGVPTDEEVLPQDEKKSLVGKTGVAKTPMLPSGAIVVEGQTIDAMSQGVSIEPGQRVVVVEVRSNRVVVRPVSEEDISDKEKWADDDPLSRPLEELGLDGLDEPLS